MDDITLPLSKREKKWRHGISKEAEKKIALALELNAKVIDEACIKPNECHFSYSYRDILFCAYQIRAFLHLSRFPKERREEEIFFSM